MNTVQCIQAMKRRTFFFSNTKSNKRNTTFEFLINLKNIIIYRKLEKYSLRVFYRFFAFHFITNINVLKCFNFMLCIYVM